MTPFTVVGWALVVAYAATIVGAAMDETKRSRIREVVDALALPLTMLMSKPPRGSATEPVEGTSRARTLSALRVLAFGVFLVVAAVVAAPIDKWEVIGLVAGAGLLVIDTLFAHIPLTEMLAALTAFFGGAVAKRASVKVETEGPAGSPTPTVTIEQQPPAPRVPGADV